MGGEGEVKVKKFRFGNLYLSTDTCGSCNLGAENPNLLLVLNQDPSPKLKEGTQKGVNEVKNFQFAKVSNIFFGKITPNFQMVLGDLFSVGTYLYRLVFSSLL